MKITLKDPKFSLVFPPDRMKLAIEIERLNVKTRFNERNNNKTEMAPKNVKKPRITQVDAVIPEPTLPPASNAASRLPSSS